MIKVVYDIKIYREVLRNIIKQDDVVVELGCHLGNSTRIMAEMAHDGQIIALDKSDEAASSMKELTAFKSNIEFIQSDVRLHETLENVALKLKDQGGCDVLSVDLGGGHYPDTTFKVFFIWSSTLRPRDTIIRNRGLLDFLHSSSSSELIKSPEGWLESSGGDGVPPRLKELHLWSTNIK
ncbi:MAG TPA: class I SAM-dependent methyltransferase [Methanobacteriaceae archaeon]|nr:class I SAM-dependent methyltransferase [Methanobacteriaceae archaeon]